MRTTENIEKNLFIFSTAIDTMASISSKGGADTAPTGITVFENLLVFSIKSWMSASIYNIGGDHGHF